MPPVVHRKRVVFAAFVILSALLLSFVVIVFTGAWKRSIGTHANGSENSWADWQLPVRIGDSLESVRAKLGQDELTWGEKGLSFLFKEGHVEMITVSTVDRPHMRKYGGLIVANVSADDGLEQLIQKLGQPSEVTDFNPNDKDYQWRRKDCVIHARIAMEDLVTIGLPFTKHQVEAEIFIDDIAPYLQADRDEELRGEILEKEKELVALFGSTLSPKEIFERYNHRVVEVQAINSKGAVFSKGTGFIWRGTEILTNCHVVEEAYSLKIKRGSQVEEARFLGTGDLSGKRFSHFSTEQDWIQLYLSINEIEFPPVVLSEVVPEVGENIVVIGNPEGLTNTMSTGIVSGIREVSGNQWIQITAPVSPGSSGSPVFDSKGRLIGLATMMLVDGQNLNFATPIRQIAAGIAKKAELTFLPLKSIGKDEEYNRRKWVFLSEAHESKEIEAFGHEFLKKYSDPGDKADVFYTVADAYSANRQFRTGLKVLREKIELFGAEAGDYLLTADMLGNASDADGMKRELRAGIMFGVRRFAKEHSPESRETAKALGQMFDKLQDRQGASQWFDISLVPDSWWSPNVAARWAVDSVKALPKWYQSERAARGKNATDVARLVPDEPESYLNSIRNRWLSQNEKEIVALMRSWGLADERANQILKLGIDSLSPSWWEQEIHPRITQDQWLVLRAKLDERKSL